MDQKDAGNMKRIKQISVTHLFGMFNHVIPLNMEERITIIHGPNGFGKTIILRLLSELFGQKISVLRTIPFQEFRVDFDDDSSFWVVKTHQQQDEEEKESPDLQKVTFHAGGRNAERHAFTLTLKPSFPSSQLSIVDRLIPSLDRVGSETWRYLPTGEFLSLGEIIERFCDRLPLEISHNKEPKWLSEIRRAIPIRFIETQRLLNPTKSPRHQPLEMRQLAMVPTVTANSEELAEAIKTKLAESTALSQSLDRTFPARLVSPTAQQHSITENELRDKLAELERKRSSLMAAGLLDQDNNDVVQVQGSDEINPSTKVVLSVYVEDTEGLTNY